MTTLSKPYYLGIDLGTTFSAAAICVDGTVETVQLGNQGAMMPSVVLVREDGSVLVGEAAEARATAEPGLVAREFKRRLGDTTPLFLGGTPYSAGSLTAMLAGAIFARVTERMGGRPAAVVVTYPASYSEYRRELLVDALREAGLDQVTLVAEPQAAAALHASQQRITDGELVAVYDFGGGTFDAALVRRDGDEFHLVGTPQGLDRLGGIDFDQAIFDHVCAEADIDLDELDPQPNTLAAVARLRADCRSAKELLSTDDSATVPVFVPGHQREVVVTRVALERMIRPRLPDTVAAVRRACDSAGLGLNDIDRVLLVGGSSRIPLVRLFVADSMQRPVALDVDAQQAIAQGAALLAARTGTSTAIEDAGASTPAAFTPAAFTPTASTQRRRAFPWKLIGAIAAVAVLIVGAVVLFTGDDSKQTATNDSEPTTSLPAATLPAATLPAVTLPAVTTTLDDVFLNRGFTYGGEEWSLQAAAITNQAPQTFDPANTTDGTDTTSLITEWTVTNALPDLQLAAQLTLDDGTTLDEPVVIDLAADRSVIRYAWAIPVDSTFEGLVVSFGSNDLAAPGAVPLFAPFVPPFVNNSVLESTTSVDLAPASPDDGRFTLSDFIVSTAPELSPGLARDLANDYADVQAPIDSLILDIRAELFMGACDCPAGVSRVPGSEVMPFKLTVGGVTLDVAGLALPASIDPGSSTPIELTFIIPATFVNEQATLSIDSKVAFGLPDVLVFDIPCFICLPSQG